MVAILVRPDKEFGSLETTEGRLTEGALPLCSCLCFYMAAKEWKAKNLLNLVSKKAVELLPVILSDFASLMGSCCARSSN
jgi:hypothetical protein